MSQLTITLSRAELRALYMHASTDAARTNLCVVWLVPDGRAFSTDGHRLAIVCPDGIGPRKPADTGACVPVARDAIASMLKGSRKADAFELATSRDAAEIAVTVTDRHGATRRLSLPPTPGADYLHAPPAWHVVPSLAFEAWDEPGAAALNPAFIAEAAKAIADLKAERGGEAGSDSMTVILRKPLDPAVMSWTDGARSWTFVVMPTRADVRGSRWGKGAAAAA